MSDHLPEPPASPSRALMPGPQRIVLLMLRGLGLVSLSALGAVLMPHAWMDQIHQSIGMGNLPDLPMISYLSRSLSLFYAWLGALVFFASFDLTRYLPLIRFFARGGLAVAILQTWIDATSPVPLWWLLAESGFLFAYFGSLLWLTRDSGEVGNSAA